MLLIKEHKEIYEYLSKNTKWFSKVVDKIFYFPIPRDELIPTKWFKGYVDNTRFPKHTDGHIQVKSDKHYIGFETSLIGRFFMDTPNPNDKFLQLLYSLDNHRWIVGDEPTHLVIQSVISNGIEKNEVFVANLDKKPTKLIPIEDTKYSDILLVGAFPKDFTFKPIIDKLSDELYERNN
ncbi:hypothetical protein DMB95_08735 [Campylobacter sp. MIT 12-8780]|uniref:hypothetical protein n=1 Tax=unclassified Campylobacter TaxID=2593542 RepID=UPI00115EFA47|nr:MULTISPECIES: hypothetical protein [unclassified Campylobacter]NDJ27962.1 hypothetical protein [Campylobacter sp. MIT 19-121]TQR40106.1 hypothetical protein DMB95_08735 [Campylobacter sp. MIT 12-8780]